MVFLQLIPEILAAVLEALGLLATINGVVQAIRAILNLNDSSSWASQVATDSHTAAQLASDATIGFGAIHTKLDTLLTEVTDLGSPQQFDHPVILPSTPPAGYGGSGGDVWLEELGSSGPTKKAGDLLTSAGNLSDFLSAVSAQLPMYYPGGWQVGGVWNDNGQADPNVNYPPQFDPTTIIEADTSLSVWIDRVYPDAGVTYNVSGQPQISAFDGSWVYTYAMGDSDFQQYQAAKFGGTAAPALIPPVWPGAANVTETAFGPMSGSGGTGEPLDGITVHITGVPPGTQQFDLGGFPSYRRIGSIAFGNDEESFETPQLLGPVDAIYTPKTMQQAQFCVWLLYPGVTATISAWTINR